MNDVAIFLGRDQDIQAKGIGQAVFVKAFFHGEVGAQQADGLNALGLNAPGGGVGDVQDGDVDGLRNGR